MDKKCSGCQQVKPITEYQKNASRRDGVQGVCRACRKAVDAASWKRHRERRQVRKDQLRRELLAEVRRFKAETPCADCGGRFHPAAMQFDHRPGETKHNDVANLCKRGARQAVWREIKKCDVVCANCHAVRTFERRGSLEDWLADDNRDVAQG